MFNGKALYNPQGRSGEYAKWAVNFYNGCTGGCEYCYNKRFSLLSAPKPTLKACFNGEEEIAAQIACREIQEHKNEIIRDGGLFLSFVSDPCLLETFYLTYKTLVHCNSIMQAIIATRNKKAKDNIHLDKKETAAIPVIILTKQTDWILNEKSPQNILFKAIDKASANTPMAKDIAFGFTLTGHDEMEPGCSSNADRIKAMKALHDRGFRTWASIEPVIDFRASLEMIRACAPFCDHLKVGLRTDKKFECTTDELVSFVNGIRDTVNRTGSTVYFKRSVRDIVGGGYIIGTNFVEEGFNMFGANRPDYEKIFKQ